MGLFFGEPGGFILNEPPDFLSKNLASFMSGLFHFETSYFRAMQFLSCLATAI